MPVRQIALINLRRHAYVRQFKPARAPAHMLGAVTRDITRKRAGRPKMVEALAPPLPLARRVR
ncbi:hypothetical protein MesoLjLc_04600 [Mesorhizobium sp. L-8-10]|uniref:hypothetical protein n=1 Tax=Mesorhizobium sp. L-8-10 TaxID=2744523 RepID=UPI001927F97D|nr:hypothetical protein [Mesorhizobium sp. L-8-10]BCH28530.1 hypothetical protein MesoLjLc_04600 [Mesorhizobium sp. L-8-10]